MIKLKTKVIFIMKAKINKDMGVLGFDVIDNGIGIQESEFDDNYLRCMPQRERNEIYKSRSIGYKGEALDCLARLGKLTILSKFANKNLTQVVSFNKMRQVEQSSYINKCSSLIGQQGVIVQARNMLKESPSHQHLFSKNIQNQFQNMLSLVESYQLILHDIEFSLTNSPTLTDNTTEKSPEKNQALRPVESTKRLKAIYQHLYKDFMIPDKTLPFALINIETSILNYDLKLKADMRKFFFKPETEKQIYELLRASTLQRFN
eukprot:403370378